MIWTPKEAQILELLFDVFADLLTSDHEMMEFEFENYAEHFELKLRNLQSRLNEIKKQLYCRHKYSKTSAPIR